MGNITIGNFTELLYDLELNNLLYADNHMEICNNLCIHFKAISRVFSFSSFHLDIVCVAHSLKDIEYHH